MTVSELLGAKIENEQEINAVAEQLSRINEQLAIKNHRSRLIWKIIAIIFIAFVVINILLIIFGTTVFNNFKYESIVEEITEIVAEDYPT